MSEIRDKLIVALDVDTLEEAKRFVDILYPEVKMFKVGSQLFTGCGPKVIALIQEKGAEVFLDLKFFDIPNTVANAVKQAVRHKVRMLTLHICAGQDMLKAAVAAAKEESLRLKVEPPLLIGVTVLTSQEADAEEVFRLAKLGLDCGLNGVVCSAREVRLLKDKMRKSFVAVTPGIRAGGVAGDDQNRTASAKEAVEAGSDFIVVGRPILQAKDPLKAAQELI